MKIYHCSQHRITGYDTFSDFVIICENEDIARNTDPCGGRNTQGDDAYDWCRSDWCKPEDVEVRYLGEADSSFLEAEVICLSFHAG